MKSYTDRRLRSKRLATYRRMMCLAVAVALLLAGVGLRARAFRVDQVPNGRRSGCNTCHTRGGGTPRNPFGAEIEKRFLDSGNIVWGPELAALDSDNDGVTDGAELGDPDGDGTPDRYAVLSSPGDPKSVPAVIEEMTVRAGSFNWLDKSFEFSEPGRGAVRFRVKAAGGPAVIFGADRKQAPVSGAKIYQVFIGADGNTRTFIRKAAVGAAAAETTDGKALLAPEEFVECWVSVRDGLLLFGKGAPGENVLLKWQDPTPMRDVRLAGFAGGDRDAQLRDVAVIPAVIPLPPDKSKE